MESSEIQKIAQTARQAAQAGAAELMRWRPAFATRNKGPKDFVTDADLASQQAIESLIRKQFPEHHFVGEESPAEDVERLSAELRDGQVCWVVDPLDGTTNYVHGFPSFAVSIAAVCGAELLAGVILDPIAQELFWAARGQGAWLGEQKLQTSDVCKLDEALVAISLPASVEDDSPDLLDFVRVAGHCQAVRRIGSAALNLAYVAAGRLDAYWAREIHAWDVAAGLLLVEEAGGRVTDPAGEAFDLERASCVATTGSVLHQELLNRLASGA